MTMAPFPRELLAIARDRHGLITVRELERERVVGRARTTALRSGLLVPIHEGVYRIGSHPETFEQRCLAACLAAPGTATSGPSGARLTGLRRVATEDVHIIGHASVKLTGVNSHTTDLLRRGDVRLIRGIPVLAPLRLLCDLAWYLDDASLESVYEQMLDRRLVSVQSARAAAHRFAARGRPGTVRLRRVLDARPAWLAPADSDLEVRLWRALSEAGVMCTRQHPVTLDRGAVVHIDMAMPELRLGIEVDHVTWHGGRLDVERDKQRDRDLARLGWQVVRVTDGDVEHRLAATVDDLIAIAHRRRAA
jgi:very-short-patch-repair endonuclease